MQSLAKLGKPIVSAGLNGAAGGLMSYNRGNIGQASIFGFQVSEYLLDGGLQAAESYVADMINMSIAPSVLSAVSNVSSNPQVMVAAALASGAAVFGGEVAGVKVKKIMVLHVLICIRDIWYNPHLYHNQ